MACHCQPPRRSSSGSGGLRALAAALIGVGLGCTGAIDAETRPTEDLDRPAPMAGSGKPGSSAPGPGSKPGGGTTPGGQTTTGTMPASAGPLPLRRLTRREYLNSVAALLGASAVQGVGLPKDDQNEAGFFTPLAVSTLDAEALREAAETIAARATQDLATLLPCDARSTGEETCARAFVETFGRRAYRRRLAAAEVNDLIGVYAAARTQMLDFATGIRLIVEAVLQSPKFLYRWEIAPGAKLVREGALVKLTPHQVAARLSFFLWGRGPDDRLLDDADAGRLGTPAEVTEHARRLLADGARVADAFADFHRQWLKLEGAAGLGELTKSSGTYPMWNDGVRAGVAQGLDAFVSNALVGAGADGKLATLLLSPTAFVNESTAALYGMTDVKGTALVRREGKASERAGLFTQPAFLAVHASASGSHPTKRGLVLWRDLLCGAMGLIPADVPPAPEVEDLSTRERFEQHDKAPCASCHKFLDPLGFAFESYDGIGRFRTTEADKPVNTRGAVTLPSGRQVAFEGAVDLMKKLVEAEDTKACVARQWFRYALGRGDEGGDDVSIALAQASFARTGDVRELVTAVVGSKTFLYRTLDEGEVLP